MKWQRVSWPLTLCLLATLLGANMSVSHGTFAQQQPSPSKQGAVNGALKATPSHGHSGDILYISGGEFPPHTHLLLLMGCPNWFVGTIHKPVPNSLLYGVGPTTDANGEFSGYRIRALKLQNLSFSACLIYTQLGANPFGPEIPASYFIEPRGQALGHCDTHVCAKVVPSPRHIRSGLVEHIAIEQGWPGATADISIAYPGGAAHHLKSQTLNWEGNADVTDRVPAPLGGAHRAQVKVSFHFARTAGNAFTTFMVTP